MKTSSEAFLRLQSRLTQRDRTLLNWLYDHQVLTTAQITSALFPSPRSAQQRLLELMEMKLVDRFRANRPGGGTYPWSYVIAHTGAVMIAARRGLQPPRPAETALARARIATSTQLDHTLGVNTFFTDLAGYARRNPPAELMYWEPTMYRYIHRLEPDGWGRYREPGHDLRFWLEYDTGTEPLTTLIDKISRYRYSIDSTYPAWAMLFRLHSTRRENNLHQRILTLPFWTPVATTAGDRLDLQRQTPADRVWATPGEPGLERLADLTRLEQDPRAAASPERAIAEETRRRRGHTAEPIEDRDDYLAD
ncbi:replication-relaxation family protein [Catellatospora bangladeshensis]|uniref:replication-relaxation family protein n=1 Tax=Catellatospora bangladeshensis TaxID=310355 RepID=UPI0019453E6F|nr:replication-relaxation family protein [Catellatospora bangladeshensis]